MSVLGNEDPGRGKARGPGAPAEAAAPAPSPEWLPTAAGVSHAAPHVRDSLDVRRALGCTLVAVLPAALVGVANAGYQALNAAAAGGSAPSGWRSELLRTLGLALTPESPWACLAYGLALALPILAVASLVGWAWQEIFARLRARDPSEAVPVVVVLFTLILPPTIPLWQVALGISFAVVIGLEIFGGTGRNVVHPALAGFVFLYFTYPASFAGPGAWVPFAADGAATVLATAARGGLAAVEAQGIAWQDTLLGREPGALGETSALACALGAGFLVYARLASWRVIAGGILALVSTAALVGGLGDPASPRLVLPWYWHLTAGSFAFGLAFLATDPVTSASTPAGRWAYGALVGFLVVVIRVFNPAHPEGAMMAVVLANVSAPLLDHLAVRSNVRRRRRRLG